MSTERSGEKHDKILEAAARVFARQGFHHSKVADIAREASVADGTIYLYFKNKDDILITLFEERMGLILARLEEALSGATDPLDKLRRFIEFHLGLVERSREMAEVMQIELRSSHKFMKDYVPTKFFDYLNAIQRIIVEGQAKGVLRADIHPAVAKRAIFGALDELSLHAVMARKARKERIPNAADQVVRLFMEGLARPGAASAAAEARA